MSFHQPMIDGDKVTFNLNYVGNADIVAQENVKNFVTKASNPTLNHGHVFTGNETVADLSTSTPALNSVGVPLPSPPFVETVDLWVSHNDGNDLSVCLRSLENHSPIIESHRLFDGLDVSKKIPIIATPVTPISNDAIRDLVGGILPSTDPVDHPYRICAQSASKVDWCGFVVPRLSLDFGLFSNLAA
ncbi:hypothetical protein M5K25_021210 [Dendrobium thyrsiflorum]|uniref:Uncharacterized protein n=1 Tax=Dendrobium thyrsiflorum TaxID=117978 RepID=A0ABD0UC18_DENTH